MPDVASIVYHSRHGTIELSLDSLQYDYERSKLAHDVIAPCLFFL